MVPGLSVFPLGGPDNHCLFSHTLVLDWLFFCCVCWCNRIRWISSWCGLENITTKQANTKLEGFTWEWYFCPGPLSWIETVAVFGFLRWRSAAAAHQVCQHQGWDGRSGGISMWPRPAAHEHAEVQRAQVWEEPIRWVTPRLSSYMHSYLSKYTLEVYAKWLIPSLPCLWVWRGRATDMSKWELDRSLNAWMPRCSPSC